MQQNQKAISIIVPTYNEKDNLKPLVERLQAALAGMDYEIVVVDDDSGDGTAELASELSKSYPLRLIVRKGERGLASAVVHGLRHANGALAGVMDADLQHPPEIVPLLLKAIQEGADIAVASRYVKGGDCEGWGWLRRLQSRGATLLAHLFLARARSVKDPMSGFFMLRREAIRDADLKPQGYKILLEILVKAKYASVAEVPYVFKLRRSGSSKLLVSQQMDYLKHLYALMRSTGEFRRFIKYCLVGASGIVVDEGIFWLLTQFGGVLNYLAAAISAEAAIITNFTLNNYFTFADRRLPGFRFFLIRLLKFNLVSITGIGIKLGVFWLLTAVFGPYDLWFNLCGIAVAVVWNYIMNTWWTWH